MSDWYREAIRAGMTKASVQEAILDMIETDGGETEEVDRIERAVFGERVECPHGCGSTVLPGASECWGCGESIPKEER